MTIGVVLCGGKSERMPHKLWLSNKFSGENLVVSAGRLLLDAGISNLVFCADHHTSALADMIRLQFPDASVIADNYSGLGVLDSVAGNRIILCADNAYCNVTHEFIMNQERLHSWAAVKLGYRSQLDLFSNVRGWCPRGANPAFADETMSSLVTPWFLTGNVKIMNNDIIATFAKYDVQAVSCNDPYWADLGTPESVKAYYENH